MHHRICPWILRELYPDNPAKVCRCSSRFSKSLATGAGGSGVVKEIYMTTHSPFDLFLILKDLRMIVRMRWFRIFGAHSSPPSLSSLRMVREEREVNHFERKGLSLAIAITFNHFPFPFLDFTFLDPNYRQRSIWRRIFLYRSSIWGGGRIPL